MDLSYETLTAKKPAAMNRVEIIYALRFYMHPIAYHVWVINQHTEVLRSLLEYHRSDAKIRAELAQIGNEVRYRGMPIIGVDLAKGPDAWAMVFGHQHRDGRICIDRVVSSRGDLRGAGGGGGGVDSGGGGGSGRRS